VSPPADHFSPEAHLEASFRLKMPLSALGCVNVSLLRLGFQHVQVLKIARVWQG
jgi:hypothetical protein